MHLLKRITRWSKPVVLWNPQGATIAIIPDMTIEKRKGFSY